MARYEELLTDRHTGETVLIKSNDIFTLKEKKNKKIELWNRRAERNEARLAKEEAKAYKESRIEEAAEKSKEAQKRIADFSSILGQTLRVDDKINWDGLLSKESFRAFKAPAKPKEAHFMKSVPHKTFWELVWPPLKTKRLDSEAKAQAEFQSAVKKHEIDLKNEKKRWEAAKSEYESDQQKKNQEILELKQKFENGSVDAIERYVEMVMDRSQYPEELDLSCDIIFLEEKKTLLVELELPNPDSIPKEQEFKYVASKDEFSAKEMKKKEFDAYYENIISQISVRTIHEIFESVYTNVVDFVTLNGWVNGDDPKTGKSFRNCIISVQAEREYFLGLNLEKVEPIQCLRGLKAQIASEFVNLAPVKPILHLDRNDKRIIESEEVIDSLDSSKNLATMDWQKFEQLVRDLFAKEFSGNGVEVKVTQASRDAGVDAIVFDPDPIKGGKFVIQAKRYNNVVGLSAVRDLYGTVMNEGAVKGILVTTATYGKDSLEFVKDKPLTLISGSELVYLFNKHGYQVNIETKKRQKRETVTA